MNDFSVQKEKAREKMLEALLEYAGACHAENIANEMNTENELEEQIPFPPELDVKIKKLIFRNNIKEKLKKVRKTATNVLQKVAIFLFIVLASFSILIASVEAFRTKVLNLIIEVEKDYTSIDLI